jgi:hypothetical protein
MKFFYTFILIVITQLIFGQNSTIDGTVVGDSNGMPIPGVDVIIKNLKLSTITDSDRKFNFRNVASGNFEVELSSFGYKTKFVSEVITTKNEIN